MITGADKAPVIDCDVHCAVPVGALYAYLPSHWREFGETRGGEFGQTAGVSLSYPSWHRALRTPSTLSVADLRSGPLAVADLAILNCYAAVDAFTHPYLGPDLARAVNLWMEAEWLAEESRLLGTITVAPQQPEAAADEIRRAAQNKRFVQVALPARSWAGYGERRFWPILEAAAECGVAVAIVYGGVSGTPPTPVNWLGSFFEQHVAAVLGFQSNIMSLIMSGAFQQWPELRVSVVESGWTWLPTLLWRMDSHWKALQREVPWLTDSPSEVVHRHFRLTTQPTDASHAQAIEHALDQIGSQDINGAEMLMFASDYPHDHGDGAQELLRILNPREVDLVLRENARAWYRLDDRSGAAWPEAARA